MMSAALGTEQAKTIGIVAIIVIVVVGALLSFLFTKIVTRLILAAIVVGLGLFVWSERGSIDTDAKKCDATFFGVHLTPSNSTLRQHCEQIANH